jgi:chaperone required for assembly of F1-ATPase
VGLAEAIAAEWREAGLNGADISPDDLPLTRLATTAIDRIAGARAGVTSRLAAFALHDLLCYHADQPPELARRQAEAWQPWLAWAARTHNIRLNTGTGITPIPQPPETEDIVIQLLARQSDFALAGLGVAIPAAGSLVLGLALLDEALDPDTACQLALLDELFQAERWGADAEAAARRAGILADLTLCANFWKLCR